MELTQAYLKECFDYDPATGNLIWRDRPREHFDSNYAYGHSIRFIGRVAGGWKRHGYWHISLLNKSHLAHRLVWLWYYGRFPVEDLDHINRNRIDNRIENLRECNQAQNSQCRRSDRRLGPRGVQRSSINRWRATIQSHGRKIELGCFGSEKDAALAYARAAVDHFGPFAPLEAKELFESAYP